MEFGKVFLLFFPPNRYCKAGTVISLHEYYIQHVSEQSLAVGMDTAFLAPIWKWIANASSRMFFKLMRLVMFYYVFLKDSLSGQSMPLAQAVIISSIHATAVELHSCCPCRRKHCVGKDIVLENKM